MIGYIITLVVLIGFSAFFSASEIAIFSIGHAKLKALVNAKTTGSKNLEYLKTNPKKTLITILIGNNIVNITASAIATMLAINVFGDIGTGIATGVMVLLILVFGEISPKAYATHNAEKIALMSAPILILFMRILYPIVIAFEFITKKITKTESGAKPPQVSEAELKAMIEMSAESGEVKKEEKEMLESVLRFSDITVREVMTHRNDMVCLDAKLKIKDSASIVHQHQFSRYPIYKKSKDNIKGIVHIKDILFALNESKGEKLIESIMSPVHFVPQHMPLNSVFKEFQDKQRHMMIIVNDHGEVIGLATLEDLLEEIVGEIIDESDVKQNMIMRVDRKTVIAHGLTELKALNRFFHSNLQGKPNDTLSAIILKHLKKIQKQGDMINISQNDITILEASPKKIKKIKIKKDYE
jgi:CBS domain containing-hemolysin-like protein